MAMNKANKAILKAKYGDQIYEAMVAAENVIVMTDNDEVSLAEKLTEILNSTSNVSNQVTTLIGSDTSKSARAIVAEVLTASGKFRAQDRRQYG